MPFCTVRRLGQFYLRSPIDREKWLAYPKVDALLMGDTKHTTIPFEGGAALHNQQDRKVESS